MPQKWGFQEKQMAYSFMTAISDGTLKSMPITFNYMKVEDIVIHHNLDRLTSGIDYTISNNVITFKNVIPALDRIAVDRMSQRDSLRVNFVEGATFSRENMDDVLTQMLYLTQEAMEGSVDRISPTGVLDLAGNRIINLGDPVDLQDAVPLHLVVDAEKSIYASEAKCKQYRDEALGYKDEAFTYADRAYASELNAKKSEDNAKTSEINAANSASSILGAVEQSAESAAAAKVSETNAKESENKTEAMVDRVEDALVAVEGYEGRVSSLEGKVKGRITLGAGNNLEPANSVNGLTYSWVNSSNIEGGDSLTTYTGNVLQVCGAELHVSQIVVGHEGIRYRNIWNNAKYGWARVYDTHKPPTCNEIGAVSSSNVVGTLAEGALFEKYYTPDGWTVIKRIDGTMEMWKIHNSTQVGGKNPDCNLYYRPVSGVAFPEPFKSAPSTLYQPSSNPTMPVWVIQRRCASISSTGDIQLWSPSNMGSEEIPLLVRAFGEWKNISSVSTLEEPEVEEGIANTLEEPPILDTPQALPYDLGIYKKEY